jgi:DNA-binding MarR family transcriptional regulator
MIAGIVMTCQHDAEAGAKRALSEWDLKDLLFEQDAEGTGGTVSLNSNPMVLLVLAANRATHSLSRRFLRNFGIGVLHWRLMVTLHRETDIPVTRASEMMGVDKAAVSRTMAQLERKGFAVGHAPSGDARRRLWRLTQDGVALHEKMLVATLERQRRQLAAFTREETMQLTELLQRLINNIEADDAADLVASKT